MDKIIFTEEFCQPENLHPFTLTRQLQDIRVGILSIREKWEKMLGLISYDKKEDDYKDLERSVNIDEAIGNGTCYMIHGNVLPTPKLVKTLLRLQSGEFIATEAGNGLAYKITRNEIEDRYRIKVGKAVTIKEPIRSIQYPWDIFHLNDWAIRQDFELLTAKRKSEKISRTNKVARPGQVFLEKGAKMEHCIVNASTGPVYIGKDAEVMEGTMIRGPLALGKAACLKMGSKIYGATTIGPCCVAGGEIKNSVFFGHSNKSHDGYIGDSVIGEWCNLGAGTTNSNLKNNASEVRIWTPTGEMNAGIKCGMLMGDFSRTAINTSINTGTVIGVCSHVFGNGLTPKYIPNFSWGSEGVKRYEFDKALEDIETWKKFKQQKLTGDEISILKYVYQNFQ
jgi:UDP-N-acetylglucosamine diphosphorylase / glucose-1-phosphate thymidylyltransferase / UDP-N-acetylgalactosamine diphosphorylase / glucosamine-1-phosphate N-acetyltransferase / galactosamine-1-phosphate N-acetyltransferase